MEGGPQTPLLKIRAWTHDITGPPEKVLALHNSLPRPQLSSGTQVLVRVKYAALNPAGSVMMQLCPSFLRTKPSIPEMDFAGQIVDVGVDVDPSRGLKPGIDVFGSIPVSDHLKGHGSLSDYVVLDACYVTIVPKGMDMQAAAGLPIAGCTALCLMEKAELKPGQKILVNGAAGGIGSLVTQMVRNLIGKEGRLVVVCSRDKEQSARELGAEEVRTAFFCSLCILFHLLALRPTRSSTTGRKHLSINCWGRNSRATSSIPSSTRMVCSHYSITALPS
jgi:NADPH:quinone reductase-like Zn-dependent oxidoreductase